MKLVNKERRLKYLGFDDKWFIVIGIVVLSFVTDYIFTNSFGRNLPIIHAIVGWSISLFFSILNWFAIREVMILLRKRYPKFKDNFKRISLFFLSIVASVFIIDWIGTAFLSKVAGINFNSLAQSKLISIILVSSMTMAIYEAIYYYVRLRKSIQEEEHAKQAIVQAQLDALRNQAQPHFLFNTLNTLRDIIDNDSKEDAKDFVDKLSTVYRFILESSNANLIPLRDEIKFSTSYMHIQKERFGENLKVNWDISDTALDQLIVPMSLQLLLENAIKHNVIAKSKPLTIDILANGKSLKVENKIQAKSTQLPSTKLGLKNIETRYNLISKQSIDISNDGLVFSVTLPLLHSLDQKETHASTHY